MCVISKEVLLRVEKGGCEKQREDDNPDEECF